MTTSVWDPVWERVRANQHTVIVGQESIPPAPDDLWVLLVRCDAPWTTGGPLDEALHRVAKLLGHDPQHLVQAQEQSTVGLRSRLFDDMPGRASGAGFVEACNRLAAWAKGNAALGFEAADAADEATVSTLAHILQHQGWLQLPVIFALRSVSPGPVTELVGVVRDTQGETAIIEVGVGAHTHTAPASFDWETLPVDVLRILRAGSVIGSEFEAGLVAKLLDEPLGAVLETLQRAADLGAALADRGEGRFFLPAEAVQALQHHMLPSLRSFWHTQLGALLSEGRAPAGGVLPQPGPAEARDAVRHGPIHRETDSRIVSPTVGQEQAVGPVDAERSPAAYAALFEPGTSSVVSDEGLQTRDDLAPPATAASMQSRPVGQREPRRAEGVSAQPLTDQARAATHLQAAGESDAAVAQYLAAVQEVAARGDARRAYVLAQQALALLDKLPPSEPRALLRVQLLLALGQVQWHSAVLGSPFTLEEALSSLKAAKAALPEAAAPAIAGQLAAVTAGICYDVGDLEALQHALGELSAVSRRLLDGGEPLLAAGLLNDQAAVYIRLGDPVRATHLLSESRRLFDGILRAKPDDTNAVEELAATEHLLARLPLHSRIRPGREDEAYAIALDHALAAESAYERLKQPWQVARVWETIGRLEMARGRPEAARGRLATALQLQQQIGDVTGLARSTAALADLCIAAGQLGEAATLLADSIALNFEKGSPIGLAFNRRAFEALRQPVRQEHGTQGDRLQRKLQEVEQRLVQAESVLGRVILPGEADAQ